MGELMVSWSNDLMQSNFRLSLYEHRLLSLANAKGNAENSENRFKNIEVRASEYAEVFGISKKNSYFQLNEASESIKGKVASVSLGEYGNDIVEWVEFCEYRKGEGVCFLSFSDKLILCHLPA